MDPTMTALMNGSDNNAQAMAPIGSDDDGQWLWQMALTMTLLIGLDNWL